ncbi:Ig-like domain-containing protein, partial [Beijerinckia sp. L45]|uniref:beta strand repeat-containing protein n=1 Tax=Beijerinckia sp. L45 TaxID=1641855 RepID=UPI001AEE7A4A
MPTFDGDFSAVLPTNGDPSGNGVVVDDVALAISSSSAPTTYTEGSTADHFQTGVSISTVSSAGQQLAGATVTISNFQTGDTLNFTAQNNISIASNSNGVLTLTGIDTAADYATALNSITFTSTSASTAQRTINTTVTDGLVTSNVVADHVNVQVMPTIAIGTIAGDNVVNASEAAAGFAISGTSTGADGQTATIKIVDSTNAVKDTYTVTIAAGGGWTATVTAVQAQALADGSYTVKADVSNAGGAAALEATRALGVDETPPTIAIGTVAGDNTVNKAEAVAGVAISGTSTGADGQTATIRIVDSTNAVKDTYTVTIAAGGNWTATVTAVQAQALADGSYMVKADVSDVAGNPAVEATRALSVDETSPTIAIGTIAGDNVVNASEAGAGVAINGTSSGADGQTATITIVDSTNAMKDTYTVTIAAGGTWTATVTAAQAQALADGSYTVKADVSDVAGNPAVEATRALTVDETPPTIAIGAIAGDNTLNAAEAAAGIAITGTSSGADGQAATITIVDGTNAVKDIYTVTIAAGGGWTATVTAAQAQALADGSYTVKADVSDVAGNPAVEATRALGVDETPPTIAIGTIAGDNTINATEAAAGVAISGTSSGADGQTATITIVDGTNAVKDTYTVTIAAGGGWTATVTAVQAQALADGSYTVKADVSDVAGNPAVESAHALSVDETPPTIAIGTIAGDNVVNASEAAAGFAISGTTSGADGQTATITIVDSTNAVKDTYAVTVAAGGGWTANVTTAQAQALADGSYTVKAAVSDVAGNPAAEATRALTVDETPPTIAIGTIAGDDTVNAAEAAAGVAIGGASSGADGQTATITIVDSTNAVKDTYMVTIAAGGGWTANMTAAQAQALADGSYTVKADVSDIAGTPAVEATHALSVDETPPTATVAIAAITPDTGNAANDFITSATSLTLTGSNTPLGTGETVQASSDGGATWANVSQTDATHWSFADPATHAASFTYQIRVVDAAGNVDANTATQAIAIDTTPPAIAIGTIAGDDTVNKAEAAGGVAVSGTSSGADRQTATITIVDSTNTVKDTYTVTIAAGGSWTATVTAAQAQALADGSDTVKADVSDVAGNPALEATRAMTVDETPPTIAIGTIAGDDTVNASEAVAGFTISGTSSGADGQTATITIVDSTNAVKNAYTVTIAAGGGWTATVTATQAQAFADGSYTVKADVSDVAGNPAVESAHALSVDETPPTIAIGTIAGDNTLNAAEAAAGIAITGTSSGADGQTATITIVDGTNAVKDTYTVTVAAGGSWTANVTAAQAQALADGSYTV